MNTPVSFEFFPPADESGLNKLLRNADRFANAIAPKYFSVTYGAGGSTRDRTQSTVEALTKAGHEVAPHLSIGSDDETTVLAMLDHYRDLGISKIVALRGDMPSGSGSRRHPRYAADLVRLIRRHHGEHFRIMVAAYPEFHPDAESPEADLRRFEEKVKAGADCAITQYFYNPVAYAHFRSCCRELQLDLPIVAGIMPITNYRKLARFSASCGADLPLWMRKRLEGLENDSKALREFGVAAVSELCAQLIAMGAPGLHFYTLNLTESALKICRNLGIQAR